MNINKNLISMGVVTALSLGSATASAVTLTFTVNNEVGNTTFPAALPVNNAPFGTLAGATDPDFRVMNNGAVSGGGEKQIAPTVTWTFNDGSGNLSSVGNTDTTPGCTAYCTTNGGTTSAQSAGGTGLFKNALFLGVNFGFLAPTQGSAAATQYGVGTISGDTDGNGSFAMFFPTLEAQWNGGIFSIGKTNGGVTFNCSAAAGVFGCTAETQIAFADDTLGFANQYTQWDVTGTMPVVGPPIPVPAAVWLFGSGLIGLVGVARRKKAS